MTFPIFFLLKLSDLNFDDFVSIRGIIISLKTSALDELACFLLQKH